MNTLTFALVAPAVCPTLAMDSGEIIPVIAIGGGLLLGLVGMISSAMRKVAQEHEREQSRREIAAYVAEGSMTAEEGAKLISAGRKAPAA
ncbi:MAG: hypothetical protein ACKVS8_05210 [Phycisphaerales bacterium]